MECMHSHLGTELENISGRLRARVTLVDSDIYFPSNQDLNKQLYPESPYTKAKLFRVSLDYTTFTTI